MPNKQPSIVEQIYPRAVAAWRSAGRDMEAAAAKGDYTRALGASTRRVATVPSAAVIDTVVPWARESGKFLGGLFGSSGSEKITALPQPKAQAKPKADPVAASLKQGQGVKEVPITIEQKLRDKILKALDRPDLTGSDLDGMVKVLPATPQLKPKDIEISRNAAIADALYERQLKSIEMSGLSEKPASDAVEKATQAYLRNRIAVTGYNPMNFGQAQMFDDSEVP